ncbi:hypothetical protein F2Q70_00011260 [Brassica cretica]|uniref:RNase H type-1 domain-containing protein n=2 Tax=Brassica cretica TaxID=69181 RepID=A0A3N6S4F3_BRACR|nr:hypothetical protein F2Q68_00004391 [Brassica cretica]KAF2615406.1 hypothetical protein F2Q70_00011260 [Brassica cretica]KAF3545965.1 hypothetical protein DY000_02006415 [Brassica cretica]
MGKSRGRGGHLDRAQWLFLGCVTKLAAADYRTEELAISSSGVLKCNVAAAWDSESKNSGAAWVVRDKSLSSLRLCNIVVEASFLEAREVIMDRFSQSPFQGLKMRISGYFAFLGPWSLNHTDPARNGVARAIADSVTSEERYNSYV